MSSRNPGPEHGSWRGGRTIASNGYVLVKVDADHHLAHVNGYAFEHRIVAEQKLGRRLEKGEEVHHINGIRTDNDPENIEVLPGSLHRLAHRPDNCDRRLPGEENPIITCECGCGIELLGYDGEGRPRKYIYGHQFGKSAQQMILSMLEDGPKHTSHFREQLGSDSSIYHACQRLLLKGAIIRIRKGVYAKT